MSFYLYHVLFVILLLFNFCSCNRDSRRNDSLKNPTQTIIDVAESEKISSITLLLPDIKNDDDNLQKSTENFILIRKLFQLRTSVLSNTMSKALEITKKCNRNVGRDLFVAFLDNQTLIKELEVVYDRFRIPHSKWLLIISKKIKNLCLNPDKGFVDFNLICGEKSQNQNGERNISFFWATDMNVEYGLQSKEGLKRKALSIAGDKSHSLRNGGTFHGFFGFLLQHLELRMNFTINCITLDDVGSEDRVNGNWTGIMGKIISGEADLGSAPITMTPQRTTAVDFIQTVYSSPLRLYIKKPEQFEVPWSAYFEVFEFKMWIAIAVIYFIFALAIFIMKKRYKIENFPFHKDENEMFLGIWGIFCQQGNRENSTFWSMRMTIVVIFMTSYIIYAAYSSFLISYLAVSKPSLPFNDLESYVKDGSYRLIVGKNTSWQDYVNNIEGVVGEKLKKLLAEDQPENSTEGFEQVCYRKTAYMRSRVMFSSLANKIPCSVASIDLGYISNVAFIIPKNSPYKELFNYHIVKSREDGIIDRFLHKFKADENISKKQDIIGNPFGITPVIPVLIIFSFGAGLGLIVLMSEKFVSKKN